MSQQHVIDGQQCDCKLPNSKQSPGEPLGSRKVFTGCCAEDMTADELQQFFCQYREVVDVFNPMLFRAFALFHLQMIRLPSLSVERRWLLKESTYIYPRLNLNTVATDSSGRCGDPGGFGSQGGFSRSAVERAELVWEIIQVVIWADGGMLVLLALVQQWWLQPRELCTAAGVSWAC